jgi:hypothetical protein
MARSTTPARIAALVAAAVALAIPAAGALARGADGTISNAAGTPGKGGFAGDGGPAGQALLDAPTDVAFTGADIYLIADSGNDRVRRVGGNGAIATAAGVRLSTIVLAIPVFACAVWVVMRGRAQTVARAAA